MAGPLRNSRHERFAVDISAGVPVLEAYARQGWRGPSQDASRLRWMPKVAARITELQKQIAHDAGIKAEYALEQLKRIIGTNITDLVESNEHGQLRWKDITKLSREETAGILALDLSGGDVRVRLHDKVLAASTYLRAIGAHAPEKIEHQVDATVRADMPSDQTPFELARRIAFSARLMLMRELAEHPQAREMLARALRGLGDQVLQEMNLNDLPAAEALAEQDLPPMARAKRGLLAFTRTVDAVAADQAAGRLVIDTARRLADVLERRLWPVAPNGQIALLPQEAAG